jgi:hypothetical protein
MCVSLEHPKLFVPANRRHLRYVAISTGRGLRTSLGYVEMGHCNAAARVKVIIGSALVHWEKDMMFSILRSMRSSCRRLSTDQDPVWAKGAFLSFLIMMIFTQHLNAQQILQTIEPGIGFSQFKQWAIENKLVFESFTKDSLVVRDTGIKQWESIRIQVRFCGGDDYAGKASNITIQQLFEPTIDVITIQRDYVEFLSGKAASDGKMPGTFSVRRDRNDGTGEGIAVDQEGKTGFWEVGLFKRQIDSLNKSGKNQLAMLQTVRRRDSVCQ